MVLTKEQKKSLQKLKAELKKDIYKNHKNYKKLSILKEDFTTDNDYILFTESDNKLCNIVIDIDGDLAVSLISDKERKLEFITNDKHQYKKVVQLFLNF